MKEPGIGLYVAVELGKNRPSIRLDTLDALRLRCGAQTTEVVLFVRVLAIAQ